MARHCVGKNLSNTCEDRKSDRKNDEDFDNDNPTT